MDRYVNTRQIGDAAVTIISDGTLYWAPELSAPEAEWRRAMPEADREGKLPFSMNLAHIRLGTSSVLVDLGFDEPTPDSQWPAADRSPGLLAGLATIGVQPGDVDHVLITHPHGDHIAGATVAAGGGRRARFPRARYLIGQADFDAIAATEPGSVAARELGTLRAQGTLLGAPADHEIAPGIALVHAPGESPGHSIVRVHSYGQTFYFLGDLFHHPCEVEHVAWVSPGRDQAAMSASRQRLIDTAIEEKALLVFSHGRFPGWGRLERSGAGGRWRWEDG